MNRRWGVAFLIVLLLGAAGVVVACGQGGTYSDTSQLAEKTFAVPTGTIADQLVLSQFPKAEFKYYDDALASCQAVKEGEADAAAYDLPILKNIAAKTEDLMVLPQMITTDDYGFAFAQSDTDLKDAFDEVVRALKADGTYDEMVERWLPEQGAPAAMPQIALDGANGTLKFATAAITEPFSFKDPSGAIVGFDVELAAHVAKKLGKKLEIVEMPFGELIAAVNSGAVDMAGACITINAERARQVLFSAPYFQGGIAALVRK